jgi:Family of unknown function (DUF6529)
MTIESNAMPDPAYRPVDEVPPPAARMPGGNAVLVVPFVVGGAVALALGAYGKLHDPTGAAVNVAGFSSGIAAKVWLACVAFVLALVQLGSALVMYGKVPGVAAPSWIGTLHRWSGRIAFLFTVPVVVHCLYALGFQSYSPRVLIHSVLGCLFFGAFTAKMLLLSRKGVPGWALPVFGGLVFTALVGLWLTSSLWFFTQSGVHF